MDFFGVKEKEKRNLNGLINQANKTLTCLLRKEKFVGLRFVRE